MVAQGEASLRAQPWFNSRESPSPVRAAQKADFLDFAIMK